MGEWVQKKLGDLITLQRGFDLPSRDRRDGEIPIVSSSGITGYHDTAKVNGPGVVIGRYGTLGEVHYLDRPYWPLNTSLFVVDFKGSHPRFISFLLKTIDYGQQNGAGAVPGVNRNHLHNLDIQAPNTRTQRRIASALAAYDDLIENNTKRIGVLEEMARVLYRSITLGFDSVALASNQTRALPAGWRLTTIGVETCFVNRGIAPLYSDEGSTIINQKCIRDGWVSLEKSRRQTKTIPADRRVRPWDVLVCSTGTGTLGRVGIVVDEWNDHTVDTHVSIVRPGDKVDPCFWGWMMRALEPFFSASGVGSTNQTELTRSVILGTPIAVPPMAVQAEFRAFAEPALRMSLALQQQNERLRAARDLLLPKLLSGELSVDRIPDPAEVAP